MKDVKQHWEDIYSSKSDRQVGWFQEDPLTSLALITKYANGDKNITIADIGGGNSRLIEKLVKDEYHNISLLDISRNGLERTKQRVKKANVNFIESNILTCTSLKNLDIWHDRAVFHFLTQEKDILKYVDKAAKTIRKGAYLILGTFSESGPDKCSGLPVSQYSEEKFCAVFNTYFELIECFEELHITPFNTEQNYIWVVMQRKD